MFRVSQNSSTNNPTAPVTVSSHMTRAIPMAESASKTRYGAMVRQSTVRFSLLAALLVTLNADKLIPRDSLMMGISKCAITLVSWMPLQRYERALFETTRRQMVCIANMGIQKMTRSSQLHSNTGSPNTANISGESR